MDAAYPQSQPPVRREIQAGKEDPALRRRSLWHYKSLAKNSAIVLRKVQWVTPIEKVDSRREADALRLVNPFYRFTASLSPRARVAISENTREEAETQRTSLLDALERCYAGMAGVKMLGEEGKVQIGIPAKME